jgi:hypothetical protein
LTANFHLKTTKSSISTSIRWRYLLAEVVLILLFSYMIFFASPHHGLYTPVYLGITAAILTVLALFYLLAASPPDPRLALPVVAVVAVLVLTSLTSIDPRRSIAEAWLIAIPFFLAFVLLELGRRGLPAELVAKSLLIAGALLMLLSWTQAFFWYRGWLADFPGQWLPSVTYRLPAPNFLAVMFNLLLMLALARLFQPQAALSRTLLIAYSLSACGLLYLTSSRGGWIGTAAGFACLALLLLRFGRDRLQPLWLRLQPFLKSRVLLFGAVLLACPVPRARFHPLPAGRPSHPCPRPQLARLPVGTCRKGISRNAPAWPRPAHLRQLLHARPLRAAQRPAGLCSQYLPGRARQQRFARPGCFRLAALRPAARPVAAPAHRLRFPRRRRHRRLRRPGGLPGPRLLRQRAPHRPHRPVDPGHHPRRRPLYDSLKILCASAPPRLRVKAPSNSPHRLRLAQPLPRPAPLHGVQAANNGDYPAAALLLEEAARRDPQMAVVHSQLGLVYSRLGDLDRAIPAFQRSLALDPDWAPNHANLGLLYWRSR